MIPESANHTETENRQDAKTPRKDLGDALPIYYEGIEIESGLRLDMLVENRVIVELKAVEKVMPVHEAQLLSYLKLARKQVGFLLNFHVPLMRDGIIRRVITS